MGRIGSTAVLPAATAAAQPHYLQRQQPANRHANVDMYPPSLSVPQRDFLRRGTLLACCEFPLLIVPGQLGLRARGGSKINGDPR